MNIVPVRNGSRTRTVLSHLKRAFVYATLFSTIVLFVASMTALAQDDQPTRKERSEVKRIHELIDKAGRLYKAENFKSSLAAIEDAHQRLQELALTADHALMEMIKPEHSRLKLAYDLLTKAGQSPVEIAELPDPVNPETDLRVSFKNQVAPLLVSKCGRCHVNRSRGNFSAASYVALGQSTMIAVGIPDDSRLIEVIVDGEMPPNGSLAKSELQLLRRWIAQGAVFDADDPNQNLNELVASNSDRQRSVRAKLPTGTESVSFGLQVAPILIDHCAQCHIDANNPRGNLSMRSFTNLLRGGDSGNPLATDNTAQSLLLQRLRGDDSTDVMPPSGKLDDRLIEVIQKWISEGAVFDGADPGSELRTVAAEAKAASQSHEQLVAERQQLASENWRMAMPDIAADQHATLNFNLLGNGGETELVAAGKAAEQLVPKILAQLKFDPKDRFLKGNASIFVFERQYDFAEFGTMVAKQSLKKGIDGSWGFTTVDAFVVVLQRDDQSPDDRKLNLAIQLAAIKTASISNDIPRWFSDGIGYWVAARIFPRSERVKSWDVKAEAIMTEMQSPSDFMTGKLPEHQSALVAYMFVKELRSNSGRFSKLLKQLRDGRSFEDAFQLSYGMTLETMSGR